MAPPVAAAPQRVVSINLCTDQLAMLLAAPGQLISVSRIALDPRVSAMPERAARHHINAARAEEVHAMTPDLVVAGEYTNRDTVALLRRLGIEVVQFDIVHSLDEVRERIAQMGRALGREAQADAMIAQFDTDLARLRKGQGAAPGPDAPRAALYSANGYTSGDKSLSGEILAAAGLRNAPAEAGYGWGKLPLEILAMIQPNLVVTAERYPGGSRAEEVMDHPVVAGLRGPAARATISDQDWVCGTPFVLRAIGDMADARRRIEAGE
ncbi:ABC transporter substrate-binding protein [Pelagivirga sediminicola]|uniref:ABC transporter substrate-binding protein n=2 Tax=Pelagivirga sediminicola TaxID=2170575 RepID=A0A2T7GCC2_9RHOB|nr:ABC transporter substrate-binding protein [Pelagivirga sediminicola]